MDDVALREIFKSVNAATLQRCRRVCRTWNEEIFRLSRYTRKFTPSSVIMELSKSSFTLSMANSKSQNCQPLVHPQVDPELIQRAIRHVLPPQILNVLLSYDVDELAFDRMMDGINMSWCLEEVEELEVSSRSTDLKLSRIINHLSRFPQLDTFSLTHFCEENISCAEIFKHLPKLRNLRIFGLNGNDGSGVSSGLIFDDAAVEQLLENQKECRRIQRIELFNTDINVSMAVMTKVLRELARLPMHQDIINKPLISEVNTYRLQPS
uniref:F-box domain-containing protein n=1 Tax=Caenorhabditis japonica TaxID=281687 RepID=A0A8R1DPE6_CAEJA